MMSISTKEAQCKTLRSIGVGERELVQCDSTEAQFTLTQVLVPRNEGLHAVVDVFQSEDGRPGL